MGILWRVREEPRLHAGVMQEVVQGVPLGLSSDPSHQEDTERGRDGVAIALSPLRSKEATLACAGRGVAFWDRDSIACIHLSHHSSDIYSIIFSFLPVLLLRFTCHRTRHASKAGHMANAFLQHDN